MIRQFKYEVQQVLVRQFKYEVQQVLVIDYKIPQMECDSQEIF